MKHKDVQANLILYLDGSLAEKEMEEINAHLANCRECTAQKDFIESIWKSDGAKQRELVSPFLWTKLEARIRSYEKSSRLKHYSIEVIRYLIVHPVGVAASIIALVAGIYLGNPSIHGQFSESQMETSSLSVTNEFSLNLFDLVPYDVPGSDLVKTIAQK